MSKIHHRNNHISFTLGTGHTLHIHGISCPSRSECVSLSAPSNVFSLAPAKISAKHKICNSTRNLLLFQFVWYRAGKKWEPNYSSLPSVLVDKWRNFKCSLVMTLDPGFVSVKARAVSSPQFLCHFPLKEREGKLFKHWPKELLHLLILFYFSLRSYQNGGLHSAVLGLACPSIISKLFDWFLLCLVDNVRTEVWVSWVSLTLVKMLWVLLGVSGLLVPVKLRAVFCFVQFYSQWLCPWEQPEYGLVGGRQ